MKCNISTTPDVIELHARKKIAARISMMLRYNRMLAVQNRKAEALTTFDTGKPKVTSAIELRTTPGTDAEEEMVAIQYHPKLFPDYLMPNS
jgi:hypothetical protein